MTEPSRGAPPRLVTVDVLRGLASLSVCWFHLSNGNARFLPDGVVKASGAHGWLGVDVFFVISGFVIPYALHQAGYMRAQYPRFLAKRVVRLDPPYLAAIALAIALGYASQVAPGYAGPPFHPSAAQIALHLGYVNVFFGYAWLNPVFWSLAIELQYYLLIGLLFEGVASSRLPVRYASMAAFGATAFALPQEQFLWHYAFLFLLGIVTFQRKLALIGPRAYPFLATLAAVGLGLTMGWTVALVGLATALAIAFLHLSARPLLFLGDISYSLYLVHVPIGSRVINLWARAATDFPLRLLGLAVALASSIGAAWMLFRLVERPARRWAGRITYGAAAVRVAPARFAPESA